MYIKKLFNFMKAGKQCYDIIAETIPQKMADGAVTVDEMAQIIKDICAVFDIKAEIKVPVEFKKQYFDVVEYQDMKSH